MIGRQRFWKDYRTAGGARPVRQEILALPLSERADGKDVTYRILLATEGRYSQVLLALEFQVKKSRKTPEDAVKWHEPAEPNGNFRIQALRRYQRDPRT